MSIEQDAQEFGVYVKQGGWRLGLLVARNVERGKGHGGDRRSRNQPRNSAVEKVGAAKFAEKAGIPSGHSLVLRYLDAWDRYAEDGMVPPSRELKPGSEVDLDEEALGRFRVTPEPKPDPEEEYEPEEEAQPWPNDRRKPSSKPGDDWKEEEREARKREQREERERESSGGWILKIISDVAMLHQYNHLWASINDAQIDRLEQSAQMIHEIIEGARKCVSMSKKQSAS